MNDVAANTKYIITKRRNTGERAVYVVGIPTDEILADHVRGTFDNTDHEILSIVNLKPEIKP